MKIAATVSLIAAVAVALMWWAVQSQWDYESAQAVATASERNDNLAVAFDQFATRTLQGANTLTSFVRSETEKVGPQRAIERLKQEALIGTGGFFDGVGILDKSGRLIATAERGSWPQLNFSEREHFKVHLESDKVGLFIGKPVESRILKKLIIPVTRRINDEHGHFDGIVVVQIAPERFTEFYQSARLTEDDFIALIGTDGTIRATGAGRHETVGRDVSATTLFRAASTSGAGSLITSGRFMSGEPRVVSFRHLYNFPLFVAVSTSKSQILFEARQRHQRAALIAASITMGVVLLLGLFLQATRKSENALEAALSTQGRLKHLSMHDPLTGFLNRFGLDEEADDFLSCSLERGAIVGCFFIDLDNFKRQNDAHGHELGDQILINFAQKLKNLLPPTALLSRIGGDEFIVLLMDPDKSGAQIISGAETLVESFTLPILLDPCDITVTASIGISFFPGHGETFSDLLRHADIAMYAAKKAGRSTYNVYTPGGDTGIAENLRLEEELRKALRLDQFELHYQPKIDMRSGTPSGLEALIRWRHPQLGVISPAVFIPIAEHSGLILPISEWVLRTTCLQIRDWIDRGLDPGPVAVNVSALQFRQAKFVEVVKNILAQNRVPASLLELEITESMVIDRPEEAIQTLRGLKGAGIHLALDDFGTGYSNLQYLKRFPLDSLKVDRSFVRDLLTSDDAKAIAGAIISLGRNLGLSVVAEGVEHHAQAAFLLSQGCTTCQGFLFALPMPAAECEAWLRRLSIGTERLPAIA